MPKTLSAIYKNKDTRDGITVKKTYNIPTDRIYIEEGFNIKGKIYPETVDGMVKSYIEGQILPDIVVEPQDNGMFKVIDGHHRFTAILKVNELGYDFRRVSVEGFNGSMVDQIKLMVNSSQGRNLNPVERAESYRRLAVFNLTKEEIAEAFIVSIPSVIHHLAVGELDHRIKEYIVSGKIAADYALELDRKHTVDQVIDLIDGTLNSGKTKATRKNTNSWMPKMGKSIVSMLSSVDILDLPGKGKRLFLTNEQYEQLSEAINALGKK